MKYFIVTLFLFLGLEVIAQDSVPLSIAFQASYDTVPIVLDEETSSFSADGIELEVLKFYISKMELYDGNRLVFEEANSYHLIDIEDSNSVLIELNIPRDCSFSKIQFQLGIDSLTNVSGAFGGALDPTKGMYWTWQSGYINFKLEGTAPNCPARHQRFQYHIGGYKQPYYPLQTITLALEKQEEIIINVAIDAILKNINVTENYQIMSPNEAACKFAALLKPIFTTL